jgi:hypothetical protein
VLEKYQMEEGTVIRFLTHKDLKAKDIQTELEEIYEDGFFEIVAVKNCENVFAGANRPWR